MLLSHTTALPFKEAHFCFHSLRGYGGFNEQHIEFGGTSMPISQASARKNHHTP
jgi:hypothetical protein